MSKGAGRPKSEMVGAPTTKKATKAKAATKIASKTAAKQSVSATVKMPVSSPVLKNLTKPPRREAAMGATVGKKTVAATPSTPEVDLPEQTSTMSSEEIEVWIRLRAYELWEQRGREHGRETGHWLEAEKEIADALSEAARTRPGKTARVRARKNVK